MAQSKKKARYKKWATENATHLRKREAVRRLTKRAQCLVADARTRSRLRGIPFSLDGFVDELQQRIDAGFCEVTGVKLDLSAGRKWNSPSLDRIIPTKGYTPRNVRVVCNAINAAMGNWGEAVTWELFLCWSKKRQSRSSKAYREIKGEI